MGGDTEISVSPAPVPLGGGGPSYQLPEHPPQSTVAQRRDQPQRTEHPESLSTSRVGGSPAARRSMAQEKTPIFWALVGCAVVIIFLAVPAIVIGSMALARGAIFVEVPVNSTGSSMVSGEGSTAGTASPTEGHSSAPAASTSSGELHWTYEGTKGPEKWGSLSSTYSLCSTGKFQSPIDIITSTTTNKNADESLTPVEMKMFEDLGLHIRNSFGNTSIAKFTGHTVQVDGSKEFFQHGATWHELLQFHFHSPSEHRIDGRQPAAELHMVHKSGLGNLVVIGILIEEGETSPKFLDEFFSNLDKTKSGPVLFKLSVTKLLEDIGVSPGPADFFTYSGSLTTPPCTEGVTWIVLKKPITMLSRDLQALKNIEGSNSRPVQPLNGRPVLAKTA